MFCSKFPLSQFAGYMRVFWIFAAMTVLLIPEMKAGELRRPGQGIRNLGMGNVGIALSHDENALFYNPAGMAGVDTILVGIPYVNEFSNDTQSILTDVAKLSGSSSTSETVNLVMGKRVHYRTLIDLNVVLPFGDLITFGAVGGYEFSLDMAARNPVAIELDWGNRLDRMINTGMAFTLGKGRWLLGVGAQIYERCDYPVTTVSIGNLLTSSSVGDELGFCSTTKLRKGQTYNFGFQQRMTSASTLRMVWGMSARNLGGLKFQRQSGETNPRDENAEYNIGFALTPFDSFLFRNMYEIDLRDFTYNHVDDSYCQANRGSSDCIWKRIHIGTEFGFWPIDSGASAIALRAGFNQGYFSYGFEFNPFIFLRALNIQYAVYKTETGTAAGDTPEERKLLQINLGF